jgi:peptide/nickel transport system permease protein
MTRYFPRLARGRANLLIGGGLVLLLALLAIFGPMLAPYDPLKLNLRAVLKAPSASHLFGADEFGRDVLSRLIYGARTTGWIALATVAIAVSLGLLFGIVAGFLRGWTDRILMILNDSLLAFPGLLLALFIMAISGASREALILALSVAYMPAVVRVARASVLSVRERE